MNAIKTLVRMILGLFGVIFALLSLAALGFCIAVLMNGDSAGQRLGQVWFQNDPFIQWTGSPSIQLVQVFFERKLSLPMLWDPVILSLLNQPAALALGLFCAICAGVAALLFILRATLLRR